MSIRRMFYLACDVCLNICDHSDDDTPALARRHGAGWVRRRVDGRLLDICPACQGAI